MALQARSKLFLQMGEYELALDDAEEYIKDEPYKAEGYKLKSRAFMGLNKSDLAHQLLREIIGKEDKDGKAFFTQKNFDYFEKKYRKKRLEL